MCWSHQFVKRLVCSDLLVSPIQIMFMIHMYVEPLCVKLVFVVRYKADVNLHFGKLIEAIYTDFSYSHGILGKKSSLP